MQWHEHLHKINVDRLTQQLHEECGSYAQLRAVHEAKQRQLAYPEAMSNFKFKEGWYSKDDYDSEYKICVDTTSPTDYSIAGLKLQWGLLSLAEAKTEEEASAARKLVWSLESNVAIQNIRTYGGYGAGCVNYPQRK